MNDIQQGTPATTGVVQRALGRAGRKTCIIVDCYSAAVPLAGMVAGLGYDVVHVQSTERIYFGGKTFRPSDFVENIVFDGDFPGLMRSLSRFHAVAVIAGVQTGVLLADRLSEALEVPTNGTAQSLDRIDKFAMFRVLEAHGLRCARSCSSSQLAELVAWFHDSGVSKAIVKPRTSAGTDHVVVCRGEQEIREAFGRIIHKENRMGLLNEAVLIQEYLEGTEYIVNTVSLKGRHRVTDAWRYRKIAVNGGSFVYEKCEILDPSTECLPALRDYVFRVLDAFGIKEGASHNEVMLTPAGPALIEINPRLAGAQIPRLAAIALGEGQLEWTAKVYLQRESIPAGFDDPYTLRRHAMLCPLISNVEGRFAGLAFKRELESLPSFQFADYFVEAGQRLSLTVDCYTQPGIVFLAHQDPSVLEADYDRIRQLESTGLYQIVS
ncbi:ATP-grasp domain-containing protein [Sorangium sp. So ce429]